MSSMLRFAYKSTFYCLWAGVMKRATIIMVHLQSAQIILFNFYFYFIVFASLTSPLWWVWASCDIPIDRRICTSRTFWAWVFLPFVNVFNSVLFVFYFAVCKEALTRLWCLHCRFNPSHPSLQTHQFIIKCFNNLLSILIVLFSQIDYNTQINQCITRHLVSCRQEVRMVM